MKSEPGKISFVIQGHCINQCQSEQKSLRWEHKGRDATGRGVPAKL